MGDDTVKNVIDNNKGDANNNNGKEDNASLSDSESSYVIEEEIVEYEITDSEEDKSMNTKKSSKASNKKSNKDDDKNEQNEYFETALKMKDEEMKNKDAIINIDDENKELNDNVISGKVIDEVNKNDPTQLSFKNVSDSMENIKVRLSTSQLNDSYNVYIYQYSFIKYIIYNLYFIFIFIFFFFFPKKII